MSAWRKILGTALLCLSILMGLQAQPLTLDTCFTMALENQASLHSEMYYQKAYEALKKAAFTLYLPRAHVSGSYMRNQQELSLLSNDIKVPVIPYEAMQDGQIRGESFWMDPANNALLAETFVTEETGGFHVPVQDESGSYPYADLTDGYILKNHALVSADHLTLRTRDFYVFNINLYQPVYQAGKIRHANQVASHTLAYQQAKKELRTHEVLQEVEHYYWLTLALQEKLRLAEQNKQMLDTLLQDVNRYYEQEMISVTDRLAVQKEHAGALLKLMQAQHSARLSSMMLNQLVGRDMNQDIQLADQIHDDFPVMDSLFLSKHAKEKRPELEMLRQQVKTASAAYSLSQKRYLPEIGFSSNYYLMNPDVYNGFQTDFGSNWNVGVTISFPLLDWGERLYTMRAMRYIQQASEESLRDAGNQVDMEVQRELFTYRELVQEWQVVVLAKEEALLRLEDAQSRYQQGVIRHHELLRKQTAWFQAQVDYIQLFADIRLAQIKLKKAGGVKLLPDHD